MTMEKMLSVVIICISAMVAVGFLCEAAVRVSENAKSWRFVNITAKGMEYNYAKPSDTVDEGGKPL